MKMKKGLNMNSRFSKEQYMLDGKHIDDCSRFFPCYSMGHLSDIILFRVLFSIGMLSVYGILVILASRFFIDYNIDMGSY